MQMNSMNIRVIPGPKTGDHAYFDKFTPAQAEDVLAFHRSFPEYSVTPLAELHDLSGALGLGGLYVKDESFRFGLNAFKVLGGSHCLGQYIGRRLGSGLQPYADLTCAATREKLKGLTFVTATDGNHGRGIAWTANRLGAGSVVYMPAGSAEERLRNIQMFATEATITDVNYDDTVRFAAAQAEQNGWVLVQDTTWPGYEEIPQWIMQGYLTMALESVRQMNGVRPTHVFLQAGVGAMAGALAAFFAQAFGEDRPQIIVVEPEKADCFYRSAEAGAIRTVGGAMDTIMAGLACGEPCTIGWEILASCADWFVSMPDWVAAHGMRVLGAPVGGDPRVISGESGASTTGLVSALCSRPELAELRAQLGLDETAQVLCISTEGDTDRANYRRVVWEGAYPNP